MIADVFVSKLKGQEKMGKFVLKTKQRTKDYSVLLLFDTNSNFFP